MADASLTFIPTSTDFGEVDVGTSVVNISYHIKNGAAAGVAKQMSIYMSGLSAAEHSIAKYSWYKYTSPNESGVRCGSVTMISCGSVNNGTSIVIRHRPLVPSGTGLTGSKSVYGVHKYKYV